ncbi:MAG TPA: HRDC domain-containing protein, partial [Candidatus Thermoplasmatota archaeon]|nr:HRDC domain-containing protein [Candidatus Thermoplasmatota archaeon]
VPEALDAEGERILQALRAWRRGQAAEEGVPAYVVAHDKTLALIAAAKPRTKAGLLGVKGMGPKRVERHGDAILRLVREAVGAPEA